MVVVDHASNKVGNLECPLLRNKRIKSIYKRSALSSILDCSKVHASMSYFICTMRYYYTQPFLSIDFLSSQSILLKSYDKAKLISHLVTVNWLC